MMALVAKCIPFPFDSAARPRRRPVVAGVGRYAPFVLLAVAIVAAARPLWSLAASFFALDDGAVDLVRAFEFDRTLREGVWYPRWAPDLAFGYGYPVFNYYARLADFAGQAFHALGLGFPDAVKAVMGLAIVVSALGAYRLAVDLFAAERDNRLIAALVAIAYVLFPYMLVDLYVRGDVAEALAAALLPWLIWAARRLADAPSAGALVLAALVAAALVLAHNLIALITIPLVCLYMIGILFTLPQERRLRVVWMGGLAAVLGALAAAIYWLPMVGELSLVGIAHADGELSSFITSGLVSTAALIQPSLAYRYGAAPFPLALTPVLLGLAGLTTVAVFGRGRAGRRTILYFGAAGIGCAMLLLDWTEPLWLDVPVLSYVQFPWRLSILIGFAVALAVGGLASVVLSFRWLDALRAKSAWRADLCAFGLVGLVAGLLLWAGIRNLHPEGIEDPQGDIRLAQIVRIEMDSRPMGVGTTNTYVPRTVTEFPTRLDPQPAEADPPVIGLKAYDAVRRALSVSSGHPVSIALHAFYFPDWQVTVDGRPARAYPTTPMGLLTFDVPPGDHEIAVTLIDTWPRRLGMIMSGLGALSLIGLSAFVLRRRAPGRVAVAIALACAAGAIAPVVATALLAQPPVVQSRQVQVSPELNLIGIHLDEASFSGDSWSVSGDGESLSLEAYWQVKGSVADEPSSWQWVGDDGRIWARQEQYPRFAAGLPLTWVPNEIVPDPYELALDPDMPSGRYALQYAVGKEGSYQTVASIDLQRRHAPPDETPAIDALVPARLGDSIRFIGYTLAGAVRAGQTSPIALYWQADRVVGDDYTVFVQMLDDDGRLVAQDDDFPAHGWNPTSLWKLGIVVQDWHHLVVPASVVPGAYHLIAGMYLYPDLERLPVVDASGAPSPDDVVDLGEVKIPLGAQGVRPSHLYGISLGSEIRLTGYDLTAVDEQGRTMAFAQGAAPSTLSARQGQVVAVTLYWTAQSDVQADERAFVQVVDDQGNIVAQVDQAPVGDTYPTHLWDAGEVIQDKYLLPLGQSLGPLTLIAGMYNPGNGERLPAVDAGGHALPNYAIPLGRIEVVK